MLPVVIYHHMNKTELNSNSLEVEKDGRMVGCALCSFSSLRFEL